MPIEAATWQYEFLSEFMHTIFYSWQSDAPRKINHDFIGDCIRDAANRIKKITGEKLQVLDGVRGESGTPALADTILERISAAHVYVADISLVYEANRSDGKRLSPNPNVVFELGYAMAELSRGRVIGVFNEHFDTPEHLPFDLQHLRWPLRYTLAPDSSKDQKAKCKENLTSLLENAIAEVLKIDGPQRLLVPRRAAVTSALAMLVEKNQNWQLALKRHAPHELKEKGLDKTERIGNIAKQIREALATASTIWELDAIEKVIADLTLIIAGNPQAIEQIALQSEEIGRLKGLLSKITSAQKEIERLESERIAIDSELLLLAENAGISKRIL